MNRKHFFKNICKYGVCGCAGIILLSPSNLYANEEEPKKEDWRIGFMQKWFAKLIESFNEQMESLLENLGRYCALDNIKMTDQYQGKIEEYLEALETKWVEKTEHDKENGIIRIFDKKRESCFFPFVDSSIMTKDFCNYSKG